MSIVSSSENLRRIELVESSFEKIKPQANEFVASFYQNLFKAHPEAQPLFKKTDMKKQAEKLLNSLVLLVENLRQTDLLAPVLKDLGARHKGYGTLPKYYPAVGEALLTTFAEYLKSEWTAETQQAWVDTYEMITQLMLEGAGATVEAETVKLAVSSPVEKVVVSEEKPQVSSATEPTIQGSQSVTVEEITVSLEKSEVPVIEAIAPIELSQQARIELVESSFEKIKPQANEFVASFYQNLFKTYPETEPLFDQTDMKKQEQKLLNSLILLVENIRQPDVLASVLKDLGARHKGYGTLPEYYPAVGEALLTTFAEYLKSEWTAETQLAWVDTYEMITQLMLEGASQFTPTDEVEKREKITIEKVKEQLTSLVKVFNFTDSFDPKKQVSERFQLIQDHIQAFSKKLLNLFWELPRGVVAGGSALLFITLVLLFAENEDSIIA